MVLDLSIFYQFFWIYKPATKHLTHLVINFGYRTILIYWQEFAKLLEEMLFPL